MVLTLIVGIFYILTDFFYWTKWLASYAALRLRKITHRSRFDLYDYETENQPEKIGILVPEEETVLETPFSEEHLQEAADEIFIYGVSSKSECLVLRISRACEEKAEAWIYLKLADGRRYELQETSGFQRNHGETCTAFSCGGLQMYYLSPMRRWRIVYCGMLREFGGNDDSEGQTVFVKFIFLWTASSEVYDSTSDLHIQLTADAMARAKWNSPYPPIDKLSETLNFYTQSGVITGTVSVEDQLDVEMYLFGERTRHLGKSSSLVGCKFKNVLGFVPENGLIVHLGRASVPNILHNLHLGFIVHPNGTLKVIEDGVIISKMSEVGDSGKSVTAMFKAGKQYELAGDFTSNSIQYRSEQGWNGYLEMHEIEFEVDGLKGSGIMISGEVKNVPERKVRKIPPVFPSVKPLTVNFTDEICHLSEVTGGKGSSLGKLTKLSHQFKSFVVPKGIVVTTSAYKEFLTPEVIQKIEDLKNVAYGNTKGNIQEMSKIVSSAIEKSYLPDKITREIEEKLGLLCNGKINYHKFAVRSSATGEDTDQMSAAGQMDTFLGVQGLKEIFTGVKKCWASQFSPIAVEYKRQNGQILNSPMAVVIQEMVDCEAAGILFTCDPVTNNPSVLVITGNYGLGESVVSGSEEPDTIVLQRLSEGKVEMKSVTIGLKEHKIVVQGTAVSDDGETKSEDGEPSTEVGDTTTEDVSEDERKECCISTEMALKLGEISLKIEDYYKSPRDIEWGIRDNIIYILQSRPVTTGLAPNDYEMKHEFDGPLRCEKEYFSTCNVAEVVPGATSPLGLEVLNKYFPAMYKRKVVAKRQRNNFQQGKYFPIGLLPFYNHNMLAIVDLLTRIDDPESFLAQSMMIGVFGRLLDDPGMKTLAKYKECGPMKLTLRNRLEFFWNLFFCGVGIEKLKQKIFSHEFPTEKCRNALETFDTLMHACSIIGEPYIQHFLCSEMSTLWNMYMMALLGSSKGGIDTDVYSDFSRLLSTQSNVESADVPSTMQNLAEQIVKDLTSESFKAMQVEEAQEWLENSTTLAGYKYRQFIKRHGHRCLNEYDVHSPTWSTDQKSLIKLLQNLSGSCGDHKGKEVADISKIMSELKVPLSWKSRLLLRFILPNCRRGVRERENCKTIVIKAVDHTRKGYQHLSKHMVSEGYIPDSDLMYFMTMDEIKDLLHTRNPRLISRANYRRKIFPTLNALLFDQFFEGRPVPMNEKEEEDIEYVADLTMKGIPVSQGSVKGYARVAISLEEASHLQQGEILITHSTDIGWSPYFPILAGVVTELGGLISHGAVVSREYGLPCVVGLHGATRQFMTGDYVLLDGNKGILQRLSAPDK